jgi:hypothetical protein
MPSSRRKKISIPTTKKGRPLDLKKYKYPTEWLQDVEKERKGIPTRGRLPKLERSLVTKNPMPPGASGRSMPPIDETFKSLERLRKLEEKKLAPKRKKRKPFEPFVEMEAKGGGKVKGYKKGGAITYRMTGGQVVDNSYD